MTKSRHNTEEALIEDALRLHEQGGDLSHFYETHAHLQEEVRTLIALQEKISSLASAIQVPDDGLARVLRETGTVSKKKAIPSPLGTAALLPFILRFGVPAAALALILLMVVTTTPPSGSPESFDLDSMQMRSLEMTSSGASDTSAGTSESGTMMMSAKMAPAPLPEPTGSVEDLRTALIAGAEADRDLLRADDEDFAYATADDSTLTSLIQEYENNI